jgi:hypothetical protein
MFVTLDEDVKPGSILGEGPALEANGEVMGSPAHTALSRPPQPRRATRPNSPDRGGEALRALSFDTVLLGQLLAPAPAHAQPRPCLGRAAAEAGEGKNAELAES